MKNLLGIKLRDKITGFEGIATSRTEWLYGCIRYGLQGNKLLKEDGTVPELQWFDEAQLIEIEQVEEYRAPTTGGPTPTPQRAKDPVRNTIVI